MKTPKFLFLTLLLLSCSPGESEISKDDIRGKVITKLKSTLDDPNTLELVEFKITDTTYVNESYKTAIESTKEFIETSKALMDDYTKLEKELKPYSKEEREKYMKEQAEKFEKSMKREQLKLKELDSLYNINKDNDSIYEYIGYLKYRYINRDALKVLDTVEFVLYKDLEIQYFGKPFKSSSKIPY